MDLTRPNEVRRQLVDHLDADGTRLSAAIDVYSERDGDQRFRQSFGWLLDGLLEEMLS